ncbi:hypothetical protein NQ315_004366 [Exocentrus adspersus]|uniref:Uncharacterized protein n=1 Tax=Exocentrus adspersus TaxID=1586481 RepID=A0AAV8W6Z0_9CUCU|nr:hypothetical protein NQ315_004366 [Exocentrus adspersus]
MKFTFICIVAVVTGSVCATGDLEVYPGLRQKRRTLESYDAQDLYPDYRRYPYQTLQPEDYDTDRKDLYDLYPEVMLQLHKEALKEPELRRIFAGHIPDAKQQRYKFEKIYKQLKEANKPRFKSYLGMLDDVRMYPQEEDDFSFNEEGARNVYGRPSLSVEDEVPDVAEASGGGGMHHGHKETKPTSEEEFPEGLYRDVKVVEDPAEFAYAPSDPRFYQKGDSAASPDAVPKGRILDEPPISTSEDPFKVRSRSDQNVQGRVNDLTFKDANGEPSTRNGVEVVAIKPNIPEVNSAGVYIIAIVAGISAAATVGLIAVGIGWYK